MVYATPFPYLFIYWSISISCRDGFVIGGWKSIIIELIAISHEIIYTLLGGCLNRSLTGIGYYRNLPPLLLLLFIFEHIFFTTFFDDSNPPMNTVQLMVSKVLVFHENKELLPSGDCYDLSMGNNDTTKHIMIFLVGISVINKLGWVKA